MRINLECIQIWLLRMKNGFVNMRSKEVVKMAMTTTTDQIGLAEADWEIILREKVKVLKSLDLNLVKSVEEVVEEEVQRILASG